VDSSANLALPYILPSQAQKHVTHNEALRILDSLTIPSVKERTLTAPPPSPEAGERQIVGIGASGVWFGKDGQIAAWQDETWVFYQPHAGWFVWCVAENGFLVRGANAWSLYAPVVENAAKFGINATADTTNRLTVSSPSTLLNHAGTDHRLVINKQATGDAASLVFQNSFSGRAEIGLVGNDSLAFKVSSDGVNFVSALTINPANGAVSLPNSGFLHNYAVNLFQDSGRFAGAGATSITVGAFAFPTYFTHYNGSAAIGLGKFIHNNTDNGGSAGSLQADVAALVNKTRDAGATRRYGNEFWVAQVTAGSGTTGSVFSHAGASGRLCLYSRQMIRLPSMTFHGYLRSTNGTTLIQQFPGQKLIVDGQVQGSHVALTPGMGWISLAIQDQQDPRTTYGYTPGTLNIYADAGVKLLLACPALMPGITPVNPDVGLVAALNSWTV
jgi:hypothetical protein